MIEYSPSKNKSTNGQRAWCFQRHRMGHKQHPNIEKDFMVMMMMMMMMMMMIMMMVMVMVMSVMMIITII